MKRFLAALALIFALTACQSDWEGQGEVEKKEYDDPDDWYQAGWMSCSGGFNGQPQVCTNYPGQWHHESARYLLVVRDDTDYKTHTISVSESVWNDCRVGDTFDTDNGSCS